MPDERPIVGREDETVDAETEPANEAEAEAAAESLSPSLEAVLEPPPDAGAVEAFHQRARLAEDRLSEVLAAYRKLKTDNEAYRDRTTRTLERRFEQRHERLLLKFIEILDNLDRALEAAQTSFAGQPLVEGLILVRSQLLQTLHDEGLERIPVLGLTYDPHVSEAVGTQPVDEPDQHNLVVKELMRGYRLKGRIARASKVLVGEYSGADVGSEAPAKAASPSPVPAASVGKPAARKPKAAEEGPSLEEIIARAEALEHEAAPAPEAALAAPEGESVEEPPEPVADAVPGVLPGALPEDLAEALSEDLIDALPPEVWGPEDDKK